jgi:hypothetical protein
MAGMIECKIHKESTEDINKAVADIFNKAKYHEEVSEKVYEYIGDVFQLGSSMELDFEMEISIRIIMSEFYLE